MDLGQIGALLERIAIALEAIATVLQPTSSRTTQKPKLARRQSQAAGAAVWNAYKSAYYDRYSVEPVRNQMANVLCKQLAEKLGAEEAPRVAEFYVQHNDSFYRKMGHSLRYLVSQAEKLRTEWVTGRKLSGQTNAQLTAEGILEMFNRVERGDL